MRKLFLLLVVLAAAFLIYNRQRVFIRDPLASVTRNGSPESGTQVYINYTNDVLLENDHAPMYVALIQKRTPQVAGAPLHMQCVHFVVCLTDADIATLAEPPMPAVISESSGKRLAYKAQGGDEVQVTLH